MAGVRASKTAAAKKAPVTKATPAKKVATKAAAKSAPATKSSQAAPAKKKAPATKAPAAGPAASQTSELSHAELAEIRSRLQAELAEMQVEYDNSMSQLDELRQSRDGAGDDQADTGSRTFEREQEQSIAANRQLLIGQIQHAIERIDSGTYGSCEDCGKPIPKARLQALPMATLDAECKARAERH
jgi:RNA polymerase-binding protein DksA